MDAKNIGVSKEVSDEILADFVPAFPDWRADGGWRGEIAVLRVESH
jgi:hypothetical protein